MPKTTTLLQLWLQPSLQGYPAFNDFPQLYDELSYFIEILMEPNFDDVVYYGNLLRTASRIIDEFFNVNMTSIYGEHPWSARITEWKMYSGR